jgi:hypothetical protein
VERAVRLDTFRGRRRIAGGDLTPARASAGRKRAYTLSEPGARRVRDLMREFGASGSAVLEAAVRAMAARGGA